MDIMNRQARQRGRILEFQNILYGYRRVDPLHGVEYILDVLLLYKKFKGRRVTVPVRRHAYVQQSFAAVQMAEEVVWRQMFSASAQTARSIADPDSAPDSDSESPVRSAAMPAVPQLETIHFVVPLSGRSEAFQRFISHFRRSCLETGEPVSLLLVLFDSAKSDEDEAIRSALRELRASFPGDRVRWLHVADAPFSRGFGLARGAAALSPRSLIFFTDIDVLFSREALHRIRMNTVRGVQVYFPIVFSEFDPETWQTTDKDPAHFRYDSRRGYLRHFGFGLVSLYRSDLDLVGGLETGIHGWGLEDVDLFEKCLHEPTLTVFRAPEPTLVHVYHAVVCDRNLPSAQYDMCLGSRFANYASLDTLAHRVLSDPKLAHLLRKTSA